MTGSRPLARSGFTLIEVLAVVFLTTLLLGVALDFYIDLSNQSARASEYTREVRRASSLLDRVAADFEEAMMVRKPEEMDPLLHPWIFLAESRYADNGADRVKFVVRQTPRSTDGPAADVAMVAYFLRPSEEGDGYDLLRWASPGLPDGLDRDFPDSGDPNALLLASDVEHFAVRFLNEQGSWQDEWDSSQIVESSELPMAVEIEVALLPSELQAGASAGLAETEPTVYTRRVQIPLRPLDLAVLLDPETYAAAGEAGAGEEGEGEDGCLTVAQCVDVSQIPNINDPSLAQAVSAQGGLSACFETFRAFIPPAAVNPSCR